MPDATRIELHALPGSRTHDLASLDPDSLVAASYLQLLTPGQWTLVPSHETDLPALKHASQRIPSSAILHHLEAIAQPSATPANAAAAADARAFHALLDQTVLPLVLHSLYSLPQNWIYVRALLAPELPFPTAFYRPNALRAAAQHTVDAAHPDWWGLGGEAEREAEEERRRKKALLETGIEGVKERKEGERREGKERMKKTFGEGKIISAARQVFTALESTLAASSTPFFFSSSTPTPLDAHLSALLSLVLYLPLPTPILADLINASFPRLWAHSALLRRTLWSPDSVPMPKLASSSSPSSSSALGGILVTLRELVVPSSARAFFRPSVQPRSSASSSSSSQQRRGTGTALTKKERDFARKRYAFFAVCAVGLVGWGIGTGAFPVPFAGRWARLLGGGGGGKSSGSGRGGWIRFAAGTGDGDQYDDDEEEEGEWEEELEDDDDEDDLDDVDDD
ncbi:hypothetical protein C6P46_004408 [Rhodotorula mucilaginosa]|uniref:Mitochondrial outer membrane transport complex Sam37/metaxin N-terminal domain-containing protein n=1 Tax=Rhodotorula mucilaginosa TaxID=5537 RepID=A0A9P6W2S6_RHOMI|nr:hypothetical protein C6P46_004408 [Rhodotorula mucilaginosa]TKA56229.1 hypothetical protein B0A53_01519 [Rhodotorula sp. CCFEE 5036]